MAELEFYCCDCTHIFSSVPDGSGYEQATCPQCSLSCMTSEFEGKSTKVEMKERMVVVAEFDTMEQAEELCDRLEAAGVKPEINSPDVGADDFFTGGSDFYGVLAPAPDANVARQIIDAGEEE